MKCQARQMSDQMHCDACGLTWDMNDLDPPRCGAMRDAISRGFSVPLDLPPRDEITHQSYAAPIIPEKERAAWKAQERMGVVSPAERARLEVDQLLRRSPLPAPSPTKWRVYYKIRKDAEERYFDTTGDPIFSRAAPAHVRPHHITRIVNITEGCTNEA